MSIQYVGARYVPWFFVNPDDNTDNWKSGIEYEPLTIVYDTDSYYISKIPVDKTIGKPSENSSFWINAGLYSRLDAEQYISNWLDEHPEATTTVQDDSLTTLKYKNSSVTSEKISNNAISYEKFTENYQKTIDNSIIKNFSSLTLYDFLTLSINNEYSEGIAVDETYIYICVYNFTDHKTGIYKYNKITKTIGAPTYYNVIVPNGIAIDYENNYLLISCYNANLGVHKINLTNMNYEGTIDIPNLNSNHYMTGYDNINKQYCICYGTGTTLNIDLYDSMFTFIKTITIPLPVKENITVQGFCFNNGRVINCLWNMLIDTDIANNTSTFYYSYSNVENEGIAMYEDEIYLSAHPTYSNGYEFLFSNIGIGGISVETFQNRNIYFNEEIDANTLLYNGTVFSDSFTNAPENTLFITIITCLSDFQSTYLTQASKQIAFTENGMFFRNHISQQNWSSWYSISTGKEIPYRDYSITEDSTSPTNFYPSIFNGTFFFAGYITLVAKTYNTRDVIINNLPVNKGPSATILLSSEDVVITGLIERNSNQLIFNFPKTLQAPTRFAIMGTYNL